MYKSKVRFKKLLFSAILISTIIMGEMIMVSSAEMQEALIPSNVIAVDSAEVLTTADIKRGDVNNDDVIDSMDYALLKTYLLGKISTLINMEAAGINGDAQVDALDFALLKKILLGITEMPDDKEKILIPHESWNCGMADGIPKPENGILVLEANMRLQKMYNLGKTQYGQRQVFVVQSGSITGSKITGSVMSGGLDFQIDLSNGAMEIEQLLMIKTNDGHYIYLRSAGTAANQNDVRMVPNFEAPNSSSYSWLNSGKYVGRRIVDPVAGTMKISVYDISGLTIKPDSTNTFTVTEPTDVKNQPWEYRKASSEKNGNTFINESVNLGSSQSVGATKSGNRNVIPITGGTVTGNINAKIIAAGADYQNLSNPATIDARYLWETDDGEIIIVRNGGQFGTLVPTFEVREDSKYSYLNTKLYLSSNPAMGASGVSITFYGSIK